MGNPVGEHMDAAGDVNDAEEGRWSTNEGRKTEEEGQQGKGMVNERGRRGRSKM